MGEKRTSMRTLPSGERVMHEPPCDAHPDGKQTLIRDCSPLRDKLNDMHAEHRQRHGELKALHHERIAVKRAAQQAKGLPPEKSPL